MDSPARSTAHPGADLAWLSWLRVLAITSVVTIHVVGYNAEVPGARDSLRGALAIYLDLGGMYAVPVFVMMSGATLLDPRRYTDAPTFLRKRALRLLPAIVCWHVWYFAIDQLLQDPNLTARQAVLETIDGNLYTALYFFWIVLGLALVSPLLIPFVRESTRRGTVIAGVALAALPALAVATIGVREGAAGTLPDLETAWTWWIPYLGLYLLGHALRGVVVRGGALVVLLVATIALGLEQGWQWHNSRAPSWLLEISPTSYYGALTVLYAVGVFVLAQSLLREGALLAPLTRPRAARLGRSLGDATLGVFALHLTVLLVLQHVVFGQPLVADQHMPFAHTLTMLGMVVVTLALTYAIVLVLRRVPVVRSVL